MELTLTREVKKTETVAPVVVLAFGRTVRRIAVWTWTASEDSAYQNYDIETFGDEYLLIRVPRGDKG